MSGAILVLESCVPTKPVTPDELSQGRYCEALTSSVIATCYQCLFLNIQHRNFRRCSKPLWRTFLLGGITRRK